MNQEVDIADLVNNLTDQEMNEIRDTQNDILDHIVNLQDLGHNDDSEHVTLSRMLLLVTNLILAIGEGPFTPEHRLFCVQLDRFFQEMQEDYVIFMQLVPVL